jgi:hypothetical protein
MTQKQESMNAEIYAAWEEAGRPHTILAFHDGYTAAMKKANAEIVELRLQLERVVAERNRLHNQCHDAAAWETVRDAIDALEARAASANETGAGGEEPRAWLLAKGGRERITRVRSAIEAFREGGWTVTPLVAPAQAAEPVAIPADVLAHIKWLHYCLREAGHCIDGGTCHHECGPKGACWRQDGCVPLTGSRLTDDWKLPATAPIDERMTLTLLRRAHKALACAALTQIPNGEQLWREIGDYLTNCSMPPE